MPEKIDKTAIAEIFLSKKRIVFLYRLNDVPAISATRAANYIDAAAHPERIFSRNLMTFQVGLGGVRRLLASIFQATRQARILK